VNRHCLVWALASALAMATVCASASATIQSRTRTVYVSVTDERGSPITDLTAADFSVKEGGKTCEVVNVEPATAQMQIALVVDDNGTGLFRYAVGLFAQRLQARAAISLSTVEPQTRKVVDYTTDSDTLNNGIAHLGPRPGNPDGGQLLEAISEAARELRRREARRPIIVALTVGGEEHSTIDAQLVLDQLKQSGAALHVISVASSALRVTRAITRPSDLLGENLNLSEVLGDGPKQSGGRHEEIVASAGVVLGLQQIADDLVHQYMVAYRLPDGVKPNERFSASVNRAGAFLRAPKRVPDK
jgi:VWFA-related protein